MSQTHPKPVWSSSMTLPWLNENSPEICPNFCLLVLVNAILPFKLFIVWWFGLSLGPSIDLAFYFNFESNRVYGAHCRRLFAQLLLKKNHLMILYTIIFPFCHMNNDLTCDRRFIKYDVRTFYIHVLYLPNYIFIICIRLFRSIHMHVIQSR